MLIKLLLVGSFIDGGRMFHSRAFKVLSNLILLIVLCTGQVAASPNNSTNKTEISQQVSSPLTIENEHVLQFTAGVNILRSEGAKNAGKIQLNSNAPLTTYPGLALNTFLGSYTEDRGYDIAVDTNGNIYVVGTSLWSWGTPINPHADNCLNGCSNVFVAKLDSSGALIWNTFFGSNQGSDGKRITVDENGNIYISGDSFSTWGEPLSAFTGETDTFVAKLNTNGILLWNTFFGSSSIYPNDGGIAVDESGNIYVTGSNNVSWGSPINAFTTGQDVFVAKLNSSGTLIWNTFMGGTEDDIGFGIELDESSNVYIVGDSGPWGTPINPYGSGQDAFIAKLNTNGVLQWNTFSGAEYIEDKGYDIDVDGSGNIYIIGYSKGNWGNPINQYAGGGNQDVFVAKLDNNGILVWHTFFGGIYWDIGWDISVNSDGNVFIVGYSGSSWGNPVNPFVGWVDAFVAKLSNNGTLVWSTFFGSESFDSGYGIVVDSVENIYIVGESDFTWGSPVGAYTGLTDAFVAKLTGVPTIQKPPLILIPGIGGSKLSNSNGEQWPRLDYVPCSPSDNELLSLRLDAAGMVDVGQPISVSGILRKETPLCLGQPIPTVGEQDFYDTTINTFINAGYQLGDVSNYTQGDNLFLFPYDWRKDVENNGDELVTFIGDVLQQTGASQTDILAHSMGGLVARVALANPGSIGKIRKVLTLGTPVLGSPKALGMLEYKSPCFVDAKPVIGCALNPTTLQEIVTNFPGVYQLLPSPMYDQTEEKKPLSINWDANQDGKIDGAQSYPGWSAIVASHRNSTLLTQSKTFHNTFDDLTIQGPSVQYVAVVGNEVPTPIQIIESKNFLGFITHHVDWSKRGDGTVPFYSANLFDPATEFDIRNGATIKTYPKVEHGALAINSDVLKDAVAFYASADNTYQNLSVQGIEALAETPSGLGTEIEIIGSAEGYIQDSSNNQSGQDETMGGLVNLNIPGSYYFNVGGTHSYYFENPDNYHVELTSTGDGISLVQVSNYQDDNIEQAALFNVNAAAGATMSVDVETGQDLTTLQLNIDTNGDGTIDETQLPIVVSVPTVLSSVVVNANPTNATNIEFAVTFSESVTGVDVADFKLTNTILTGASITGVTGTGAGPYTVTVNTGTGNGTIRLDASAAASIQGMINAFVGPYAGGETYTVDKRTAPTVPVLKLPANNALVTGYLPTLDWGDSSQVMALTVPGWHYEINVTSPLGYNQTFNTMDNVDPLVGLGASQYTFAAPLPANTTFTWKVRAYNNANQYSAWSATRTFRTMLATPVLNLPANGTTENNKRPTFSWNAVSGATSYTLQILKGTTVAVTGTITAPLHAYTPIVDLLPGIEYTWKVKANGTNAGVYSETFTFTTSGNPPKVPVLTLPANAALVDSALEVKLKWNHVPAVTTTVPATSYPAAASFEVEYATNSAFTGSTVEIVNWNMLPEPQQLSLSIGTLAPNLTYSWRVRSWSAINAAGDHSVWSAARTFRTKPPSTLLATPVLGLPADLTALNNKRPTFSWSEVPGVTTYTLQILKGTTVVVTGTIKPPAHTYTPVADLLPNTTYTWKVKSNGLVSSGYSIPFTFTTSLNAPKVPVLFAPAVNALVDSALPQTLDWNPVQAVVTTNPATSYPAAISYDVEYATSSTFVSSTLVNVAAPDTQYLIANLPPANTTFYWRVRSYNITGQVSAWSASRIFKTRLGTPILNLPANGPSLNNKRPTFSWDEVPGATSYTLQIFKGSAVVVTGTITSPAYTYTPTADLLPSITYTWKVKANGVNAGVYSTPFTFTTSANPPTIPVLFAPATAALLANNPAQTLDWNASLGAPAAGSYEIEYTNNRTFTGATFITNTTPAATTQLSIVTLPGRTYYWRVRSWSGAGATGNHSAWSAVRTVNVKFVAPTLTTPITGATVDVRPTFTWTSTNGLWTSYTLQVANNAAFTLGLRSFTVTAPTTTYTIPNTLPALTSGTKYWRVKINGLYTPITSAYQTFIVP